MLTAGTTTPQPMLESSHSRALVGEQIHMRCVVRVERGVNVHYSWTYSSGEVRDSKMFIKSWKYKTK